MPWVTTGVKAATRQSNCEEPNGLVELFCQEMLSRLVQPPLFPYYLLLDVCCCSPRSIRLLLFP